MMTKSKKFLMLMLTLVVSVAGHAQTEINGIYYDLDSEKKEAKVTSGDDAYSGDIKIPSTVTFEKNEFKVTSIEMGAFTNCGNLSSISIPESVSIIGSGAFSGCGGLTSVTLPNSIKIIWASAFHNCANLTSINIPESVERIDYAAFSDCPKLTSIIIPKSMTRIEASVFANCSSLTSVTIPESVSEIEISSFSGCESLTSVTLPNSINFIRGNAFGKCTNLKDITCLATTPPTADDEFIHQFGTLHVLPGCKAKYEADDVWKNFTIVEDANIKFVTDLIAAIGKVENTAGSKAKIAAARSAYDALTKEQQALVKNLSVLVEAEEAYKQFEAAGIAVVETKVENKVGKYLENGKIVIVKNGKKYNMSGQTE